MTNCNCGNPLRKGESECDKCVLKRWKLLAVWDEYRAGYVCFASEVIQALRRAESHNEPHEFRYDEDGNLIEESTNDGE